MNSNQAQYLLKCASGLQKSAAHPLQNLMERVREHGGSWWKNPEIQRALIGGGVGGVLGGGAGYLLSDDDTKARGAIAGTLGGIGLGSTIPPSLIAEIAKLTGTGQAKSLPFKPTPA